MATTEMTPAARLRALRESAGLDRAGLAERAGVSAGSIAAWENGTRTPQPARWHRVMAVLDPAHAYIPSGTASHGGSPTDTSTKRPSPTQTSDARPTPRRAPRRARGYTPSEDGRIRRAVEAGRDLDALARSLDRPLSSVRRRAAHLGVIDRPARTRTPLTPDERRQIIDLYRDGTSRPQIARALSRSVHTVNAVIRQEGIADRMDVSPVYQRPDGSRKCRKCQEWLPQSSYGSGRRGTCRPCRLGTRAQPRMTSDAKAGPRVRAATLVDVITSLIEECGSVTVAAERVGLGEDALLGIRRRGADPTETTGLATADQILVAAGMTLDLLPDDAIIM